ncbi:hypothetical protein ACG04Q_11685 [Roseateles sp. DXS20W]|uniref:Uncharacterized protein n=1 Tax=Pelomonas lactea TaxID=3299030 RepID=A0ABW7GJU4_9BURK
MFPDWVEPKWQQRRGVRKIHVVAVLSALLAAGVVYVLFSEFGVIEANRPGKVERQLVAAVDLRVGNPAGAAARGEARARADVEASLLQLETFGDAVTPAQARLAKQRYGLTWVNKGKSPTPLTQAHADAYNRVMRAEIERRHGREVADELLPMPSPPDGGKDEKDKP